MTAILRIGLYSVCSSFVFTAIFYYRINAIISTLALSLGMIMLFFVVKNRFSFLNSNRLVLYIISGYLFTVSIFLSYKLMGWIEHGSFANSTKVIALASIATSTLMGSFASIFYSLYKKNEFLLKVLSNLLGLSLILFSASLFTLVK